MSGRNNMSFNPRASCFDPAGVKTMTCAYWATQGWCKYSEKACLYAHRHTGHMALLPRKIAPNRPAVAGRNAMSSNPVYTNWREPRSSFGQEARVQERIDAIINEAESVREVQDREKDEIIKGAVAIVRAAMHISAPLATGIMQASTQIMAVKEKIWTCRGHVNDGLLIEEYVSQLQEIALRNAQLVTLLANAQEDMENMLKECGLGELIGSPADLEAAMSQLELENGSGNGRV